MSSAVIGGPAYRFTAGLGLGVGAGIPPPFNPAGAVGVGGPRGQGPRPPAMLAGFAVVRGGEWDGSDGFARGKPNRWRSAAG